MRVSLPVHLTLILKGKRTEFMTRYNRFLNSPVIEFV